MHAIRSTHLCSAAYDASYRVCTRPFAVPRLCACMHIKHVRPTEGSAGVHMFPLCCQSYLLGGPFSPACGIVPAHAALARSCPLLCSCIVCSQTVWGQTNARQLQLRVLMKLLCCQHRPCLP